MAENTIIHEISLVGYKAASAGGMLDLGTWGSYGIEKLHLTLDAAWQDLTITAFFNVKGEVVAKKVVGKDGYADVPWEATKENTFAGRIVFEGSMNGQRRITTDLNYKVTNHSKITDIDPVPTDDRWNQFVTQNKEYRDGAYEAATKAEARAEDAEAASEDAQAAMRAAKASEVKAAESERAAKASEQAAAKSAQAALESKTAAATSEVNAAASAKKAQDVSDSLPADYTTAVNDIATLKQQVANITPDDSSIGDKPWSSKNIIDMLCPPLEESGNPVVCYPVAGYPLGIKAKWEPMQEGSGTPSPENIRPIKGRDSVTVERCGGNLLNPKENNYNTYTPYGLTINYIGDNKVHLKGTYNLEGGGGSFVILDSQQKLLAGRNLKITGFTIEGTKQTYRLYGLRTKDETAIAMNAEFAKGDVIDMTVAIVVSKDTPTTYTPYIGQTNTLTLPETVYGGEVDAVTGSGRCTWNKVSLDGTESWIEPSSNSYYAAFGYIPSDGSEHGVASHYPYGVRAKNLFANKNGAIVLYGMNDSLSINEWKSFLAAQHAAGTPVQIVYKLAEPVPFTATGAQPIPVLAGVNTVLTDADSATVTGRADPIKRITDLEAAVASIN